jgi:hypothetical protein
MLGITRNSRIDVAHVGQFGTSIWASVDLIMNSPPSKEISLGLQTASISELPRDVADAIAHALA